GLIGILAIVSLTGTRFFLDRRSEVLSFLSTGAAILLLTASVFLTLFPRVMVSSLGARYDLTIYNASSNPYSLHVMTIVALTALPFVLAYQIWTYWIFRRRVSAKETPHY
ncbi:Cytochrome bd ubiquinol oxidase, subunit II, partial [mine drainage metagenome]